MQIAQNNPGKSTGISSLLLLKYAVFYESLSLSRLRRSGLPRRLTCSFGKEREIDSESDLNLAHPQSLLTYGEGGRRQCRGL